MSRHGVGPPVDGPIAQQRAAGAGELGEGAPIGRGRGRVGDLGGGQVVLPRQHEERGGRAGGEAILLGAQLDLGGGAGGARRFDALAGGLERGGGVAHFDGDLDADPLARRGDLPGRALGDGDVGAGGAMAERDGQHDAGGDVGEAVQRDRFERGAERALQLLGELGGQAGERAGRPRCGRRRRRGRCSRRRGRAAASGDRGRRRARSPAAPGARRGRPARAAPAASFSAAATSTGAGAGGGGSSSASVVPHCGASALSRISALSSSSARVAGLARRDRDRRGAARSRR